MCHGAIVSSAVAVHVCPEIAAFEARAGRRWIYYSSGKENRHKLTAERSEAIDTGFGGYNVFRRAEVPRSSVLSGSAGTSALPAGLTHWADTLGRPRACNRLQT